MNHEILQEAHINLRKFPTCVYVENGSNLTVNICGLSPVQVPKNLGPGSPQKNSYRVKVVFICKKKEILKLDPGPDGKFLLNMPLFNSISGSGYNDEFIIILIGKILHLVTINKNGIFWYSLKRVILI